MAWRGQNNSHPKGRVPGYYARNRLYPEAYAQNEAQTRVSRRVHDGFTINTNYGLDTTSDDVNSSPYSSPYYVNGRYNSDNLTTQRANSASVQGIKKILFLDQFKRVAGIALSNSTPKAVIEMWQGKQIKFEMPYDGKLVGNQLFIKNTDGCTGILSIYISNTPDGAPLYETAIDLCDVSQDYFEKKEVYSMTVVPPKASNTLYVRMEIWDEVDEKRSANPFNTGKKIEIAATGLGNHEECITRLGDKNVPVKEEFEYSPQPNRPHMGLIYSDWESIPVDRIDNMKLGASVTFHGDRYDLFGVRNNGTGKAYLIVVNSETQELVTAWNEETQTEYWEFCPVDPRAEQINIAQVTMPGAIPSNPTTAIFVVDGYSPLRWMPLGRWTMIETPTANGDEIEAQIDKSVWYDSDFGKVSSYTVFTYSGLDNKWYYNEEEVDISSLGITLVGGDPVDGATINISYVVSLSGAKSIESIEYVDVRAVMAPSLIMFHNNRLYISGFRNDPNLVQCSAIEEDGPKFNLFPYRFYVPNRSPYDMSHSPITAMVEYASDQIMFIGKSFFSIFRTYSSNSAPSMESGMPTQVTTYVDSSGVQSQGDICNYKGVIYSYDEKEGIRRFSGATWNRLPSTVDSHYDRVDMTKPRKIWGLANKLYFNYYDSIDGKAKCLIWDMEMSYQQYPWFQDIDIPFCDVRYDNIEKVIGIHPDYPMIMQLYAENTWRRLDSPIYFRRDTKFLNMPGNAADFTVSRAHVKVLNNSNRWWYISLLSDKQNQTQFRGHDTYWRQPVWDTITVKEPVETPFPFEDTFEENAVFRLDIMDIRIRASAIQVRVATKTFRTQANLVSAELEVVQKQYL